MNNAPQYPQQNHPHRRPNDFQYNSHSYPRHQVPYAYNHQQHYHHVPPQQHHYPPQWYQPYQYNQQFQPQRHFQPQPQPQSQAPLIVSSHPHALPVVPVNRLPSQTPQPGPSTPSVTSQSLLSPPTTPTTTTTTPPPALSTKPLPTPQQPSQPSTFDTPLPWLSCTEEEWAQLQPRRTRRKPIPLTTTGLELPSRKAPSPLTTEEQPEAPTSLPTSRPLPESISESPLEISSGLTETSSAQSHKRALTKPVVPVIPKIPTKSAATLPPTPTANSTPHQNDPSSSDSVVEALAEIVIDSPIASTETKLPPPKPTSWAALFASRAAAANAASSSLSNGSVLNGISPLNSIPLSDALRTYDVGSENKISFLEPRGLVNTGNMCYMNSILQILVFCVPFYEFLDQVSKRAAHSFKSDTPLIEAMIMFMREFNLIDSANSVDQLRLRLKDSELEQYGDSFIPEYVYDVIKRLPRFSTMRRGHQQDAEEFLGFLLEGLHDECAYIMRKSGPEPGSSNDSETADSSSQVTDDPMDGSWLEVGPKQKPSVTRSSGMVVTESPITKIFGGKLRSEFRVPGLKNSVTLEPYQPLQLDIGDSSVSNITDALKGLTRSESIHGNFNSPRGPGATATKQVFIETLPPVLILHLKRFQYDNTGGTQKIWKKVGYPLELEIPKEVFPQAKRAQYSNRPGGLPKYRLIGVVYHHGKNASGGHYTVDVRRQEGREWIRLDDTFIRRVRAEDVAGEGGEEDPKILAAALEQHKRDSSSGANIFNQAGFGEEVEETEQEGGWSQVSGNGASSPVAVSGKKWAGVVNGTTGSATPTSAAGGKTPKEVKGSAKDNKVAYILFYQQIRS